MKRTVKKVVEVFGDNDFGEAVRNLKRMQEAVEFERAKKMLSDNGNKIPYHRWYKGEQYNYKAYAQMKGKVTGYFKTVAGRYSGGRQIATFYKVHETGVMVYINQTMFKMGICQGLTAPHNFQPSSKKEWSTAYREFIKLIA